MRIFFSPSRALAAHRLSHPGSRIYDPRERWLLRALDGLLRLGTIPLRARPAAVDRGARIDTSAVRKVTEHLTETDYKFSALVNAVVNSVPFQYRQVAQQPEEHDE